MVGNRFAELGGVPDEAEGSDHEGGVRRISTVVGDEAQPAPVCRCEGTGMVTAVSDKATGKYLGTSKFDYPDREVVETMHPCPACRPEQFMRFEAGCFKRDHDRTTCSLCQNAAPIKGGPKTRMAP